MIDVLCGMIILFFIMGLVLKIAVIKIYDPYGKDFICSMLFPTLFFFLSIMSGIVLIIYMSRGIQ